MGRRIEPYEIERAACECAGVEMSAVCFDSERVAIELFYTGEANEREVKSFLRDKLPRFMLPRWCTRIDRMPQKENGKLDRTMLESFMYMEKEEGRREKA